jgi:hypothetical protein
VTSGEVRWAFLEKRSDGSLGIRGTGKYTELSVLRLRGFKKRGAPDFCIAMHGEHSQ